MVQSTAAAVDALRALIKSLTSLSQDNMKDSRIQEHDKLNMRMIFASVLMLCSKRSIFYPHPLKILITKVDAFLTHSVYTFPMCVPVR